MKSVKWCLLLIQLLLFGHLLSQTNPLYLRTSIGLATYYGDLTEKAKLFNQSSPSFSIGLSYNISKQLIGKFDFSIMKLKADDRFNTRQDFLNRNLNFTTTLWDIQIGVEHDFFNKSNKKNTIVPYFGIGFGLCHFNPWTYDRTFVKRYLRQYGTEGQGLPSYPERKVYSNIGFSIPINFGIKYAINERIKLVFDFNLRQTFTDYLDDVGNTYPDKSIVLNEAKDPTTTIGLTYRGDEISSVPYPSTLIQRGGYTNDFYYTTSLGLIIMINNKSFIDWSR